MDKQEKKIVKRLKEVTSFDNFSLFDGVTIKEVKEKLDNYIEVFKNTTVYVSNSLKFRVQYSGYRNGIELFIEYERLETDDEFKDRRAKEIKKEENHKKYLNRKEIQEANEKERMKKKYNLVER